MPDRPRVRQVVLVEEGLVLTRWVRSNAAPPKLDGHLQDIYDEEGLPAVQEIARKWYHGLVVRRG